MTMATTAHAELILTSIIKEKERVLPLMRAHYGESEPHASTRIFNPAWDVYAHLEASKAYLFIIAQHHEHKKILGYVGAFLTRAMHAKDSLMCVVDGFYVVPEARGNSLGIALISEMEAEAKRLGANRFCAAAPVGTQADKMLGHLGMFPVELLYSKEL